jgi:hypothetical protein
MYEHFWSILLPFLHKAEICQATPYICNKRQKLFTSAPSTISTTTTTNVIMKTRKKYNLNLTFKRMSYLIFFHMVVMVWNVIQSLWKETSFLTKSFSLGVAAVTLLITICRWIHLNRSEDIVHFLNCMVLYEGSLPQPGNSVFKKLNVSVI